MENPKQNKRVSYSKKMIRKALYELSEERPLEKITVKELCEKADVNRSTFYSYYLDIYDLHQKIITEFFLKQHNMLKEAGEMLKNMGGTDNLTKEHINEIYLYYLTYIKQNKDLYKFIYNKNSSNSINVSFGKFLWLAIKKLFNDEILKKNSEFIKTAYNFIIGGITAVVMDWLMKDCAEDENVLAENLSVMLYGIYEKYISQKVSETV